LSDLLLDTHVLLWWEDESRRLGEEARRVISDRANRVHVSAASVWEANLKVRKGKLKLRGSLVAAITSNGFFELPVTGVDAERAGALEWAHTDPFDRLLLAQAMRHGLVLVTSDAEIVRFRGVAQLWAGA
jgi:PIN domain nuclease of toxin-antitoxin system